MQGERRAEPGVAGGSADEHASARAAPRRARGTRVACPRSHAASDCIGLSDPSVLRPL